MPLRTLRHNYSHDEILRQLCICDGSAIAHPSLFIRTSSIQALAGYNEKFTTAQDLDLYFRLSEIGNLVIFLRSY